MKSYIQYLSEAKWRKLDDLVITQPPIHNDKGWIDYLRKHLRSKQSSKEFIRKNPTYDRTQWDMKDFKDKVEKKIVINYHDLSEPVTVEKDVGKKYRLINGHHRYWARRLEGKKRIKTDK